MRGARSPEPSGPLTRLSQSCSNAETAACFVQRSGETNFRVRNCRIFHLKSTGSFGSAGCLLSATVCVAAIQPRRIGMNNKLLNCLIAGALATALALASPALARGGGGGGGHGGGGGGMVVAACMAGWRWNAFRRHGWRHACRRHGFRRQPRRLRGQRVGFAGSRFAGPRFAHAGFAHHGRFFHHRFHRFAFIGVARPTPTLPTTAAGAGCGRPTDCNGSTSAATTAITDWRIAIDAMTRHH